jgi:regulator of protease activity HflC (stomatin/prohibitin superfamily)
LSKETIEYLKAKGWVHPSTVKGRNERKAMEQKFWVMDKKGDGYIWSRPAFAELDLDNLSDDRIKQLADGAEIVQKVTAKSVLPDKTYQKVLTARKAKEALAQKRKENADKRAAKKKAKEIAEAKKLLQEAGELS